MVAVPLSETQVNGLTHGDEPVQQYDAIIVGAGFSGIANLYRLRKDGLKVHVFESGMYLFLFLLYLKTCQSSSSQILPPAPHRNSPFPSNTPAHDLDF